MSATLQRQYDEAMAQAAKAIREYSNSVFGRFCLLDADTNRRYLLVGTGTGITPYRAMLPQLRRVIAQRNCEVALIFGARNEQELLYDADFSAFEREVPGFRYYACLSRAARALPRTQDRNGHVLRC